MTGALIAAGSSADQVRLSGETGIIDAVVDPANAQAGVRFNSDGTIDKNEGGSYTQIDANTDWIIPNGADKTPYTVRCTDNNANLAAGSAATGTWLAATSTWNWYIEQTSFGTKNLDIDLEISPDGGTTIIASGNYTGSAQVDL